MSKYFKSLDHSRELLPSPPALQLREWAAEGWDWAGPSPEEGFMEIFWRVVRKRKWVVAVFTLLVLVLVTSASLRMKRRYEAVGRVVIYREPSDVLGLKDLGGSIPDDPDSSSSLDTQIGILQSDSLALQVIKDLHLNRNPNFTDVRAPVGAKSGDSVEVDPENLLGTFHAALDISKDKGTRLVEIRFLSTDPRLAADVVNALSQAYVEQNFRSKLQSTMQISDWLSTQLAELREKVETSQKKLVDFQKENGILGIDENQNIITSKLDDLNKELTAAQADRIEKQSHYWLARSGNPELVAKAETDGQIAKLRAQQADLSNQYAQLSTQLGPAHPKVLELKNQLKQSDDAINSEIGRMFERYANEYLVAKQREKMIWAALEQQKQAANNLNLNSIKYSILKRDVEANRRLYEGLLEKLKEAAVSAGLKSTNIRIVDAARIPRFPAEPNIPRNLAAAVLLGIFGGICLAFVLERFDNTVRTPQQMQHLSPLPALSIVPRILNTRENGHIHGLPESQLQQPAPEMITYLRPVCDATESYKAVLTSVLLFSDAPPKVIMVGSAVRGEGKTTTSINSAIVLAREGRRVLLVDTDLRRPGIDRALRLKVETGLSTLRNGSELKNAVVAWGRVPGLFVLPAGPSDSSHEGLSVSGLMKELLSPLRKEFDHIVIDSPPILQVNDSVRLAAEADSVVLVVRSGQTTRQAFCRAQELLLNVNARITGIVLNAADLQSPDFSSGYGHYGNGDGNSA